MANSWMVFRLKSPMLVLVAVLFLAGVGPLSGTAAQGTDVATATTANAEATDRCAPRLPSADTGDRLVVSSDELNLRSGPSVDCPIIAELKLGDSLHSVGGIVEDDDYDWLPVTTGTEQGFVISQGVQPIPADSTCESPGVAGTERERGFIGEGVNLRQGPGLGCVVLAQLSAGTPVSVRGEQVSVDGETWLPVSTPSGNGYIVLESYLPPGSWDAPVAVAVLMYHDLNEAANRFVVAPSQLEQQLIWLRDNGYTSVTPRDLIAFLDNGAQLPPRPVILSVDDGWPSARIFRDLLAAYGFRGTYMLPSYAELGPDEIYQLNQNGEVCGHSVSHPFLDQLGYDGQYYEIVENKAWLDHITGVSTTCFAYPFGAFDGVTTQIVIDAGYRVAFHAWDGIQYFDVLDRWHITRIEVSGDWDLATFAAVVSF